MKQTPLIIIFTSLIVFGFILQIQGLECYSCIDILPNNTDCNDMVSINTVNCGDDKSCYYVHFIVQEGNVIFRTCDIKNNGKELAENYPLLTKINYTFLECQEDGCNEGSYSYPNYLAFITTLLILARYLL